MTTPIHEPEDFTLPEIELLRITRAESRHEAAQLTLLLATERAQKAAAELQAISSRLVALVTEDGKYELLTINAQGATYNSDTGAWKRRLKAPLTIIDEKP